MIPGEFKKRFHRFLAFVAVLAAAFSLFLVDWARFCLEADLFSYTLIIPLVSVWLVWQQRDTVVWRMPDRVSVFPIVLLSVAGLAALGASFAISADAEGHALRVALRTLAFALLLNAGTIGFLGAAVVRQILFPCVFLFFMVPFPPAVVAWVEVVLQVASAEVSGWFFGLIGLSHIQEGRIFVLPNITIEVARECSGIRSTIVLFITGLIAAYLFLERNWQRVAFCVLIVPLGIVRNAFRIVTIGWLCTHYGPEMIHSPIHHRGGPVFFALSLVPLFVLLWLFRRMNRRDRRAGPGPIDTPLEVKQCPTEAT